MNKNKVGGARAAPSKIGIVLLVLLLVVFLGAAGCGVWYAFETHGFTQFVSLEYNGSTLGNTSRQILLGRGSNEFEIKNMNPFTGELNYTVEIKPNAEETFNFTVDSTPVAFSRVGDLTKYFGIKQKAKGFTMEVPEEYTMQWLMSEVYEGREVEIPAEGKQNKDYFILAVKFSDGMDLMIRFNIRGNVEGVEIDPPGIVF